MRFRERVHRLHQDERGLKTLEVVAILAIACIILSVIRFFWFRVQNWFVSSAAETDEGWSGSSES